MWFFCFLIKEALFLLKEKFEDFMPGHSKWCEKSRKVMQTFKPVDSKVKSTYEKSYFIKKPRSFNVLSSYRIGGIKKEINKLRRSSVVFVNTHFSPKPLTATHSRLWWWIALGLPFIIIEFSSGGCAWVGVGGENMRREGIYLLLTQSFRMRRPYALEWSTNLV